MNQYRMVVSDFDGTLLRSDDTVSEHTRRVIAAFRAMGGVFAVSTGRMHRSIVQRIAETGIEGSFPLMSYQGALVRDSVSGKTLFSCPMDSAAALKAIETCESSGIYCQYYDFDDVYVPRITEDNARYCKVNRVTPIVVGRLSTHLRAHAHAVAKVLMIVPPEKRHDVCAQLRAALPDSAQVFISAPYLVEAVSPKAGKHNGLCYAAAAYGIPMREVIAVGDEMNDAGMLAAAGLGVAMANASEEVKTYADEVTDTNDKDGVAKIIEKYCL